MGLNIVGTVGILMTAFDEKLLSAEEIEQCIDVLRSNRRHISDKLYEHLMEKIRGGSL